MNISATYMQNFTRVFIEASKNSHVDAPSRMNQTAYQLSREHYHASSCGRCRMPWKGRTRRIIGRLSRPGVPADRRRGRYQALEPGLQCSGPAVSRHEEGMGQWSAMMRP